MPKAECSVLLQAMGRCSQRSGRALARRTNLRRDAEQDSGVKNSNSRAGSAITFAAEFFQQFDLNLLNLEEPIVLASQQVIDFFVEMPDFKFGFEIDLVIIFSAQPVTRLSAVLTHHDDRRLNSGET